MLDIKIYTLVCDPHLTLVPLGNVPMSSCLDCWEETEQWLKANAPDFVYESAKAMHDLALKQKTLIEHQNNIIHLKEQLICGLFVEDEADMISQDEADDIIAQLENSNQQLDDLIN